MSARICFIGLANLPVLAPEFVELVERMPGYTASMIDGPLTKTHWLHKYVSADAARIANLIFHGQLPYRPANRSLDRARLLVDTTEIEGFPNTFLQAWVRGIPVVSLFDPDEVIRREGLGHAVASLDELGRAAERLTTDSSSWFEVSARCRAYMAWRCGEDQVIAPYLSAVGRVAMGSAAPAPA
jgi:hypothetical protein